MHTAILSVESERDFQLILELSKKLNFNTKILSKKNEEDLLFLHTSETSLAEWLTREEDEAWKNL